MEADKTIGEVTPEMLEAATRSVMDRFAAEWGSRRGISHDEAEMVAQGVIKALQYGHIDDMSMDYGT